MGRFPRFWLLLLNLVGILIPFVLDHDDVSHHIVFTDNKIWDTLITDAWNQYVSRQVQHRKTMSDLCGLDPHLVRVPSRTAAALESSLVSSLQSGCFIGAAHHAKFDPTKVATCAQCEVADEPSHWLKCPRFAELRHSIEGWNDETPYDTQALCAHLLPSRSPFATAWKRTLLDIEDSGDFFSFSRSW